MGTGAGMRNALMAITLVAAVGCSSGDEVAVAYGSVTVGEVTETVAAPASIQPRERATVMAPATGVVEELLVADGDEVTAGQVLVRLGSPTLAQQVRQAEAAVAAAGALGGLSATLDLGPVLDLFADQLLGTVGPVLDALDEQAAAIENQDLRGQAEAALADARAQYEETLSALEDVAADARASAEDADAAQRAAVAAQRAQAQAALDALESQQERLEILAPIDGVVELARGGAAPTLPAGGLGDLAGLVGAGSAPSSSSAPLAVGAEVNAGQTLLAVFDLSGFHASAQVDEVDVVDLVVGQAAIVLVDALPDEQLRGRVDWVAIQPVTSGTGVAYDVEVLLLDPPASLRVGLTASVEIDVITVESDTVVPTSALLRRGGQEIVYVRRNGVAVEVPVVVDAIGLDLAAVTGDLVAGDEIVVDGVELVSDGDELP